MRWLVLASLLIIGLLTAASAQQPISEAQRNGPLPGPFPLFPADNWWNQDISGAPVDARSAQFISFINNGGTRRLHPDFGGQASPGSIEIFGFPYAVVTAAQPRRAVQFEFADESDGVDHTTGQSFPFYPIPDEAITQPYWIEGGFPGSSIVGGDRHMLIVDRDRRHLYELFDLRWNGTQWTAGSGAFFDLNTNNRRPEGWTSADAAGLAILPGLVRYDETFGADEIRHAFRVTVRATNGFVWPSSHRAGSNAQALPMGARLRLKASKDLSGYTPEIRRIFRAMQRYGLIVADNGSDMYISGVFDTRWNNDVLNPAFRSLTANDFDVIELGWRGGGPCSAPSAPQSFTSQVSGQLVTLNWASATDPQDFVIEAGSAPGLSNLAVVPLPGASRTITATAPPATYYVRIKARNACGVSPASSEIVVVVGGCNVPSAPTALRFTVAGRFVTVNWNGAANASDYVIEVGSTSGASDMLVTSVTGTSASAFAAPFTYFVRVRGRNGCGMGVASNEIQIIVS